MYAAFWNVKHRVKFPFFSHSFCAGYESATELIIPTIETLSHSVGYGLIVQLVNDHVQPSGGCKRFFMNDQCSPLIDYYLRHIHEYLRILTYSHKYSYYNMNIIICYFRSLIF